MACAALVIFKDLFEKLIKIAVDKMFQVPLSNERCRDIARMLENNLVMDALEMATEIKREHELPFCDFCVIPHPFDADLVRFHCLSHNFQYDVKVFLHNARLDCISKPETMKELQPSSPYVPVLYHVEEPHSSQDHSDDQDVLVE